MNSWHSFSPNGRWLVFSSKARSRYTQMYLTHVDENGDDSPAILIENATAANRAVNIPEFVNIAPDGITRIDAPATEFYRLFDVASELGKTNEYEAAIAKWNEALALSPDDAKAHNNLGVLLAAVGRGGEAMEHYRKALESEPDYPDGNTNLGIELARAGKLDDAIPYLEKAAQLTPWDAKTHSNLGAALAARGRTSDAIAECEKALQISPGDAEARANLAIALAKSGRTDEAIANFEKAVAANAHALELRFYLGRLLATSGRFDEAIPQLEKAAAGGDPEVGGMLAAVYAQVGRLHDALETARKALAAARERNQPELVRALSGSVANYEAAQR
jgi:Flp pilus assembly protein TadD